MIEHVRDQLEAHGGRHGAAESDFEDLLLSALEIPRQGDPASIRPEIPSAGDQLELERDPTGGEVLGLGREGVPVVLELAAARKLYYCPSCQQ